MRQERTVALVTGGARRLGRAIVSDLAAHGFAIAVHCHRSRRAADELAAQIRGGGGEAAVLQADLSAPGSAAALVAGAQTALGPVRLLVNSASVFRQDDLRDFDWSVWESHFAVHLKAPVALARAMAAALPAGERGLIVNMIDQRVWKLTPRFFTYTLSKAALWTATQTMAQALAPAIRVNAIGPGPAMRGERQNEADFRAQVASLILKRGPDPSEFGATIRYLWETPSITGQMIALDGGQHLAWETPDVTGIRE